MLALGIITMLFGLTLAVVDQPLGLVIFTLGIVLIAANKPKPKKDEKESDVVAEEKPVEIQYDMEGDPIGQKTSFWDILPILLVVGGFVTVMVLYFWALQSAVSGG